MKAWHSVAVAEGTVKNAGAAFLDHNLLNLGSVPGRIILFSEKTL